MVKSGCARLDRTDQKEIDQSVHFGARSLRESSTVTELVFTRMCLSDQGQRVGFGDLRFWVDDGNLLSAYEKRCIHRFSCTNILLRAY